jgi:hypothetical protein
VKVGLSVHVPFVLVHATPSVAALIVGSAVFTGGTGGGGGGSTSTPRDPRETIDAMLRFMSSRLASAASKTLCQIAPDGGNRVARHVRIP